MKNAQQASKEVLTATTPIKKITKIYSVFLYKFLKIWICVCVRCQKSNNTGQVALIQSELNLNLLFVFFKVQTILIVLYNKHFPRRVEESVGVGGSYPFIFLLDNKSL